MATEYISRDKINEAFDSIWDCADMVFEPDDHCCAADDCGRCKWLQTKNAIKKKLDHIPTADVRPVKIGHYVTNEMGDSSCSECGEKYLDVTKRFCPECGAELRRNDGDQRSPLRGRGYGLPRPPASQ